MAHGNGKQRYHMGFLREKNRHGTARHGTARHGTHRIGMESVGNGTGGMGTALGRIG